jgi:ATP-dependent RNA helicase RhlE
MRFEELNLIEPLLRAVRDEGYTEPTPIQEQAIGPLLTGRDMLGCAQTGTGKTAAFALPILQKLAADKGMTGPRKLRVLVLAPTRELAAQINESFQVYGKHTGVASAVIFGGVGQEPQVRAIRRGVDVLVATPGRLLDLMGQGLVKLNTVDTLVLDEADRMLDMGFVRDVRKIVATVPTQRQTLLFSATMAPDVQELAEDLLRNPVRVSVTPSATTVDRIVQSVYHVTTSDKRPLLEELLRDTKVERALVFTRTKHGADKVVKNLDKAGIEALAIHGNKSQNARTRALDRFKSGETRVLIATDIAARGIDVDGVSHVINHDLPNIPDSYVHRIGRTARAGADGIAISFCDAEERPYLRDIEKLIRKAVPIVKGHAFEANASRDVAPASRQAQPQGRRPQSSQRQPQGRPQQPHSQAPQSRSAQRPAQEPRRDDRRPVASQPPAAPRRSRHENRPPQAAARPAPVADRGSAPPQERIARDWW